MRLPKTTATTIITTAAFLPAFLSTMRGVLSFSFPASTLTRRTINGGKFAPRRHSFASLSAAPPDAGDTENPNYTKFVAAPVLGKEAINGGSSSTNGSAASPPSSKYGSLLRSLNIADQIKQVPNIPSPRTLSSDEIFCNREMKLSAIKSIGFDMDYTLVQYEQPAFDKLAFDGTKRKLVERLGYPEEVLDFEYDHEFWIRGLIIDTKRGNFLKIDRHKYVRVASHGFSPISSSTRKVLYSRSFNKIPSFSEKYFVNLDTLFQHVDAHLFALLIELKDKSDHEFLDMKTYEEIFRELRESVDLCHRDGVIKDEVAKNPEKYIVNDKMTIPMLESYRKAGIKVFLLTNSYWEYTSDAMNYLYHGKKVDEETRKRNEWMYLFDIIIVGSCKPAYLVDPNLNLFRVNPRDGSLLNTDGIYEMDALGYDGAQKFLDLGKVFQGGNWNHLNAMLQVEAGEEILYVGDHLYSDVLRSKRTLGWRTALIVPELSREMKVFSEQKKVCENIMKIRQLRDELSSYGDYLRLTHASDDQDNLEEKLKQIDEDEELLKATLSKMTEEYHAAFHPVWGQMFRAGYQDSRFAFYVQNYACLYMSKVTNLGLASLHRSFRTSGEMLPHEKLLEEDGTTYVEEI